MHRLYDYVRGRRIRRSRGQLFFGWMARSPVLVSSRVTAGADSVAVEKSMLMVSYGEYRYVCGRYLFAWGAYRTSPMIQDRMMSVL